jgi:hypothetical protein
MFGFLEIYVPDRLIQRRTDDEDQERHIMALASIHALITACMQYVRLYTYISIACWNGGRRARWPIGQNEAVAKMQSCLRCELELRYRCRPPKCMIVDLRGVSIHGIRERGNAFPPEFGEEGTPKYLSPQISLNDSRGHIPLERYGAK